MQKRGASTITVVAEIVIVLALLFIAYKVITNISNSQNSIATTCGNPIISLGGGKGVCKVSCSETEQAVKGLGCPGKDDKDKTKTLCCIPTELDTNSGNYCGDNDYTFRAVYVDVNDPADQQGCKKRADSYTYDCTQGTIKLKIGIYNSGTKAIDIFANPKVSIDNKDTWPFGTASQRITPGNDGTLLIDLKIDGGDTTYIINPGAKCISAECKKNCDQDGIFRINLQNQITIVGKSKS